MTRVDEKQRERYYLELFAQLWSDFPKVTPLAADPPAPDFLLPSPNRVTGIELTRFTLDANGSSGSPSRALDSLRNRILQRAKQTWDSQLLPPVEVGLIWNDHLKISGKSIAELSSQLMSLVTRHLPMLGGYTFIAHPTPGWRALPKQILALSIARPHGLDDSFWNFSHGGAVPYLHHCADRLQAIAFNKEPKIADYRKHCQHVWLLIIADASNIQSLVLIDHNDSRITLTTSFDRVFFLSTMYRTCVELSVRRP